MCPGSSAEGFGGSVLSKYMDELGGLPAGARVAIALSGGADSAALLAATVEWSQRFASVALRALHIHHGFSGSDALAAAAAQVALVCHVPMDLIRVQLSDAPGLSVEAEARRVRYEALGRALVAGEVLLMAHHQEDQAETLLLQLLRGAGVTGLAAMPAVAALGAGQLWRPLLAVPAQLLKAYASTQRLPYRLDPMNEDPRFDRSYLRQSVWPRLIARWPQAARTLSRSAGHAAAAQRLLDEASVTRCGEAERAGVLAISALQALSSEARRELIRYWLRVKGLGVPPTASLLAMERCVLAARVDGTPWVRWPGVEVRRYAGGLYASAPLPELPWVHGVALTAGRVDLGGLGALEITLRTPAMGPLTLRRRQGGERLCRVHGGPTRPLKDWLREAGIPPWTRTRAVLCYHEEQLLGVITPAAVWWAASAAAVLEETGLRIVWLNPPSVLFGVSSIETAIAFR